MICLDTLQREHRVNPPNDEHALVDFHVTIRHDRQMIAARRNPARLQRGIEVSKPHCPVYRSIHRAIEITTELRL